MAGWPARPADAGRSGAARRWRSASPHVVAVAPDDEVAVVRRGDSRRAGSSAPMAASGRTSEVLRSHDYLEGPVHPIQQKPGVVDGPQGSGAEDDKYAAEKMAVVEQVLVRVVPASGATSAIYRCGQTQKAELGDVRDVRRPPSALRLRAAECPRT